MNLQIEGKICASTVKSNNLGSDLDSTERLCAFHCLRAILQLCKL